MAKGGDAAPEADPAIGEAALKNAQLGEDWLQFSRDQFAVSQQRQAELDDLTRQVTEQQLGLGQEALTASQEARDRYKTTFQPIEDQFVQEASTYASPERQAAAAAEAGADVQSAAAAARGTAEREAASMGLDPRSGRFAAIRDAGEVATGLATAGAKNNARQQVRDKGLALKADVVNLGRGLPAQAASEASGAIAAGNSALGNTGAANASFAQGLNIMGSGFNGAQSGYGNQANILSGLYNSKLNAWSAQKQADAQESAGWGSAIGTGLGLLIKSDPDAKEEKEELPEEFGLTAVRAMPVERWRYKQGEGDEGEHVGPYADDFTDATGLGDKKNIAVQDMLGITLKAVQELDEKVDAMASAFGLPPPANDKGRSVRKRRLANDNAAAEPAAAMTE